MPHTLAEKILLAHTDVDEVAPGQIVMVRCDVVLTNDISGPMAFRAMEKMGATRVFDPAKVVVVPDHFVPAKDTRSAELQKLLRDWSHAQGVTYYMANRALWEIVSLGGPIGAAPVGNYAAQAGMAMECAGFTAEPRNLKRRRESPGSPLDSERLPAG